jgi:hypothetical protein
MSDRVDEDEDHDDDECGQRQVEDVHGVFLFGTSATPSAVATA